MGGKKLYYTEDKGTGMTATESESDSGASENYDALTSTRLLYIVCSILAYFTIESAPSVASFLGE